MKIWSFSSVASQSTCFCARTLVTVRTLLSVSCWWLPLTNHHTHVLVKCDTHGVDSYVTARKDKRLHVAKPAIGNTHTWGQPVTSPSLTWMKLVFMSCLCWRWRAGKEDRACLKGAWSWRTRVQETSISSGSQWGVRMLNYTGCIQTGWNKAL